MTDVGLDVANIEKVFVTDSTAHSICYIAIGNTTDGMDMPTTFTTLVLRVC